MYKNILIATDGSELATRALEHGLAVAKRDDARVTIVTVTEQWSPFEMANEARQRKPDPVGHFEELATAQANRILDDAMRRGSARGVVCEPVHVRDQHPAEGIVEAAKNRECDLIVMGSHGRRGVSRLLLGSQAYEVLTHCTVPALIVR